MLQKVGCYNSKKNVQKVIGFRETKIGIRSLAIDNSVEFYGIDRMPIKQYRIDGSIGTRGRQPAPYNFRTDKPLVSIKSKKPSDRLIKENKKTDSKNWFSCR